MASASPTIAKSKPRGASLKTGSSGGNAGNLATIRLKVVVRHLPSLMKEEEFKEAMAQYVNKEATEWFSWVQGKVPEDRNKPPTNSRCVIKFRNPLQIAALSEALRTHGPFVDSKGNATSPQMEYSPFQKVPKKPFRIDARAGTIENDQDFIVFLASLNVAAPAAPSTNGAEADGTSTAPPGEGIAPSTIPANDPLSVPLPSGEKPEKPKTTPLIEFLRTSKSTTGAADKSGAGSSKASIGADKPRDPPATKREKRRLEKARVRGKERELRADGREEGVIKQAIRAIDMEAATILKRESSAVGGPLSRQNSDNSSILSRQNSGMSGSLSRNNSGLSGNPSRQNPVQAGPPPRQGNSFGSNTGPRPEKSLAPEKPKRERRRERGNPVGVASVAAILHRDLGITAAPRRPRNQPKTASALETATQMVEGLSVTTSVPPAAPTYLEPQPPTRLRRRGGRNNGGRRPEREESVVPNSPPTAPSPSALTLSPPVAPLAILKKESSSVSSSSTPAMLQRESSSTGPPAPPTGPAMSIAGTHVQDGVPTAPKGGGRHRRGSNNSPARGGGVVANAAQTAMSMVGVPTAPASDSQHGGKGRRGGGRGYRGGRGRGEDPSRRGFA